MLELLSLTQTQFSPGLLLGPEGNGFLRHISCQPKNIKAIPKPKFSEIPDYAFELLYEVQKSN